MYAADTVNYFLSQSSCVTKIATPRQDQRANGIGLGPRSRPRHDIVLKSILEQDQNTKKLYQAKTLYRYLASLRKM